jgi:hypothetical protein
MNIKEAYLKYKKQLVILVSGLAGSGKTVVSKLIADDYEITHLKLKDYFLDQHKLSKKFSFDAIDWDKVNQEVDKLKHTGVIVSGLLFDDSKMTFNSDYNIHIKISKQNWLTNRSENLIKTNKENHEELMITEKKDFNAIWYPYYLSNLNASRIDKFYNINETDLDKLYNDIFDQLSFFIKKSLDDLKTEQ